jgi:hypothetical protein
MQGQTKLSGTKVCNLTEHTHFKKKKFTAEKNSWHKLAKSQHPIPFNFLEGSCLSFMIKHLMLSPKSGGE